MKDQRHFIYPLDVFRRDNRIFRDVTKMSDFCFDFFIEEAIRAAKKNIRLNAQTGKFLDTMLRRFSLQFAATAYERNQS